MKDKVTTEEGKDSCGKQRYKSFKRKKKKKKREKKRREEKELEEETNPFLFSC